MNVFFATNFSINVCAPKVDWTVFVPKVDSTEFIFAPKVDMMFFLRRFICLLFLPPNLKESFFIHQNSIEPIVCCARGLSDLNFAPIYSIKLNAPQVNKTDFFLLSKVDWIDYFAPFF